MSLKRVSHARFRVTKRTPDTNVHADQGKKDEVNSEISRFMNNYNLTDLSRKLKALNIPKVILDGPDSKVFFQNVFKQIFDEQRERENLARLQALVKESQSPAKMNSQRWTWLHEFNVFFCHGLPLDFFILESVFWWFFVLFFNFYTSKYLNSIESEFWAHFGIHLCGANCKVSTFCSKKSNCEASGNRNNWWSIADF